MKKDLFIIGDVHGYYTEMIKALKEAGYNEHNPKHLLISLGDEFDRGREALAVYEYLKRLSDEGKAIILKGNHSQMFTNYLDGTSLRPFNYFNNGTNETLADFLHETAPFETWCVFRGIDDPTYGDFAKWLEGARKQINEEYPELLNWLKTRPYHFEAKNYVFTHGAIDTEAIDWHNPHCFKYSYTDWEALTWDNGSFFGKTFSNTNKKVVIGHFSTKDLRDMYKIPYDTENAYDILYRDDGRVIAIDGCTALTRKVNVLKIENEEVQ